MITPRYSTTLGYLKASLECELATLERRTSLVAADELARLGELAFSGPDGSLTQFAFDSLAQDVAMDALGMKSGNRAADLESHAATAAALLESGFTSDMVASMRRFAEARAGAIVRRAAKMDGIRSAQTRTAADGPPPAVYLGVWKVDAVYDRGQMVTHNGVLFHAEAQRTSDRPGNSAAWRMMHKSMEKAR